MSSEQMAREIPVLTDQVGRLVGAVTNDSSSRARFERTIGRNNRILLAVVAVVAAIGIVTAYGVYNIIAARGPGRAIQHQISDCVNPAGQCYKQARASEAARDNAVVDRVVEALRATADCRYGVAEDLRQCLNDAFTRALNEPTAP